MLLKMKVRVNATNVILFLILLVTARTSVSGESHLASVAPDEPQPGIISSKVVCKSNPEQTYALYLPAGYSPSRRWPLIAAFDPGARGNIPVEQFKIAADRYGYIVCGSNNSRNGPIQPSAEAAKALLEDVGTRFSIDAKQVYLTGFSGGARAATAIASWLKDQITGVIGCGAGFAVGLEPSSSLPFIFYGTIGTDDFNFPEMKQLDRALNASGAVHHVEVFEGGHNWAPPDVCVKAIEWMELQAMKSKRRTQDDPFIDRLLKSAEEAAQAYQSDGRVYEAYVAYSGIAIDYKGIRDVSQFEKKAAVLKDSKPVKQALSKERDQETEQIRRSSELFDLKSKALRWSNDPSAQQPFLIDLKRIVSDLKRKSDAKEGSVERSLARRVLNQYTIGSFEQSMALIQSKKFEQAVANLAIDAEAMPDNWRIWYNLACAASLNGDKRRALDALNKAVQKGFSNVQELERNSQLDAIREEAGFKKIVDGLRQKG
jgi:dienelactone hydrolase